MIDAVNGDLESGRVKAQELPNREGAGRAAQIACSSGSTTNSSRKSPTWTCSCEKSPRVSDAAALKKVTVQPGLA